MTTSQLILKRLSETSLWLACHEFQIMECADTAISARLRELAREGKVVGRKRKDCAYKEWSLVLPTRDEREKEAMRSELTAPHGQFCQTEMGL